MKESHLIFGLMKTFNKPEFSIDDLRHLTKPFKISDANLRITLYRMVKKKTLRCKHKGRFAYYCFNYQTLKEYPDARISFYPLDWDDWNESWYGISFTVPETEKNRRYSIRKQLIRMRFACQSPGFWIRPYNPEENLDYCLKKIKKQKNCIVIRFNYLSEPRPEDIARLWNISELHTSIKKGIHLINRMLKDLHKYTPEEALIKKMEVGDRIVKLFFKDPLLPRKYLPDDWQGMKLRKEFFHWDRKVTKVACPYWGKIFEKSSNREKISCKPGLITGKLSFGEA